MRRDDPPAATDSANFVIEPVAADRPAAGARMGRYQLGAKLGAGGLGTVYRARDVELERDVAIKFLHGAAGPREELLAEAQVMARLSDPGRIVQVFEVAEHDGSVALVMELVDGVTLRRWLAVRPRSRREIVAAFVDAGRGLAAAHRAGVVHRDFKPDNVLVSADGRVRVGDFGLASVGGQAEGRDRSGEVSPFLDATGRAVAGTPAYMAPEQYVAGAVDSRADQFAFCVALYEALAGARPFAGTSPGERYDNIMSGGVARSPAARRIPARLRRLLVRGLAPAPAERFPSMDALVLALARDPGARTRRVLVTLAAAAAAAGVALLVRPTGAPVCQAARTALAPVWSADERGAVARAFTATGHPNAGATTTRVHHLLDAYASAWTAMRVEACEATAVRHEQSPAVLDLRMACLDRRRAELRGVAGLLAGADAAMVDRAVAAASGLTPVEGCADKARLAALVPPPEDPALRERVARLQPRLDALHALDLVGRVQDGLAPSRALEAEVRQIPFPALHAEALELRAWFEGSAQGLASAEKLQRELAGVAAEARDDVRVARAWMAIGKVVEGDRARAAEVTPTRLAIDVALARAGNPPRLWAQMLEDRAENLADLGRNEESQIAVAQAVTWLAAAVPPDEATFARAIGLLAGLDADRGRIDDALRGYDRMRALAERHLGAEHPLVATSLVFAAHQLRYQGHLGDSKRLLERARAIQEGALPADSPVLAQTLEELGAIRAAEGARDEALALLRRALAAHEKLTGAKRVSVVSCSRKIADLLVDGGKLDEAEAMYTQALATADEALGPDSAAAASVLSSRGAARMEAGRLAEARADLTRSLALREQRFGPEGDVLIYTLLVLGAVAIEDGHAAEGLGYHRRALAIAAKVLGPTNVNTALLREQIGEDLLRMHLPAEALASQEQALSLVPLDAARDGQRTRAHARALAGIAESQLALGRPALALSAAESVLALGDAALPPGTRARVNLAAARALWLTHGDRRRANELARAALAAFAGPGLSDRRHRQEVEAWLQAHQPRL